MKKIYILIIILSSVLYSYTNDRQIILDINNLRSNLTKEILDINSNNIKNELGKCGFVKTDDIYSPTEEVISAWLIENSLRSDITIPIAFHIIYDNNGDGFIEESIVSDQIDVLNNSFSSWGISFVLSSIDYNINSNWFNNDNEQDYKQQLAISPSTTLNIYTTTASGYLGYAYLPDQWSENSYMHGIVINYKTLPGVYNWEYDSGDTAVHEVGHYLGLLHTFDGGCYGNGDFVSDTPFQDNGNNIYDCWEMDTCPENSGSDPIYNYMNYTDDACINQFTIGQLNRINYMLSTYKPNLGISDSDGDGCLDDVDDNPNEWDDDYDNDGFPDDCDNDDDNDGAVDSSDSNDNNQYICSDVDSDTCNDCSSGYFNPDDDGPDYNNNGICDSLDPADSDGDGIIDNEDSDPNNQFQCSDNDGDGCDDCSLGSYSSYNDGSDYDSDGICDFGDIDDDNDGIADNEDCAPQYELAYDFDCCGICGGDNSQCSNCCGMPFNDDCSDDCAIDLNGVCCHEDDVDACGECDGDNECLCVSPYTIIDGHCLHEGDLQVLQTFINNSVNSNWSIENCDINDLSCGSPNPFMDSSQNWQQVVIDGESFQLSNDNESIEPLELGLQEWVNGRLTSLMCGAYIYCGLSGNIPDNISELTEIEVLRLETNYFSGTIPENICEIQNVNFSDYISFDLSYNSLCPPYPDCIPESAVNYMYLDECILNGDVNYDGLLNILDIVSLVEDLLAGVEYIDGGDMNNDSYVNIIDVVILVEIVLNP